MQTAHFDTTRFEPVGIRNERAPYLGPVLTTPEGVLQQVLIPHLLNEELRNSLFSDVIAAGKWRGCDAVVLGCTEFPLLISAADSPLPVLDSTRILARAALREAIH